MLILWNHTFIHEVLFPAQPTGLCSRLALGVMTDTGGVVSYTLGYVRLCLLAHPVLFTKNRPRAFVPWPVSLLCETGLKHICQRSWRPVSLLAKAGLGKY